MTNSPSSPVVIRVRISVVYPEMGGAQFAILVKDEKSPVSDFGELLRSNRGGSELGGTIVCTKEIWNDLQTELVQIHKVFFKSHVDRSQKEYYSSKPKIVVVEASVAEPQIWIDEHKENRTPFFRFPVQSLRVVEVREKKIENGIKLDHL
jgi:hypothetical protein